MLTAIKLLHTVIWAVLAGSIVVLPMAGVLGRFRWALVRTVQGMTESDDDGLQFFCRTQACRPRLILPRVPY